MVNSSDFIKRLEQLLQHYDLNASAFADKIQVQRSNISHLMSGRNKPSLEFVLKVVKQFPEVNLYWLLNGKGTFPSEDNKEVALSNQGNISEGESKITDDKVAAANGVSDTAHNTKNSLNAVSELKGEYSPHKSTANSRAAGDQGTNYQTIGDQASGDLTAGPENESFHTTDLDKGPSKSSEKSEKQIERIVIFYTNGSFESFSNR